MLEFVDPDLYFVQDKNNFINPLLQVGSGSVEKNTGSGSGWPKITGSDRGSGSGSSSLYKMVHYFLDTQYKMCQDFLTWRAHILV